MREVLSTENSELVCNELHVETIPKKDLQWTSWQLDTSQKLRADEQCDGVYNRFFCANPERALSARRPKDAVTTDINFDPQVFMSKEIHW